MISKIVKLPQAVVRATAFSSKAGTSFSSLCFRSFSSAKDSSQSTDGAKVSVEDNRDEYLEVTKEKAYKIDRYSLTPHQFWLTQGKGMERPYTGDFWDNKDIGHYECVVCTSKLFQSDQQFHPPTGMASFWNHIGSSIDVLQDLEGVKEDKENLIYERYSQSNASMRVCCNKCKSHLGVLHLDGPPPTFKRFSINSGALKFIEKPWFEPPHIYKERRQAQRKAFEESKQNTWIGMKDDDILEKQKVDKQKLKKIEDESQANFEKSTKRNS